MTILNIGHEALNSHDIAEKVEADIAFLTDRLALLRGHSNPNPAIIESYQSMLASRQTVLAWLLQDIKKASNG